MSNEVLLAAVSVVIAALSLLLPVFWKFLQSRRLQQEEAIHRESHNLKLFEALASRNHQLQLAAAAVLVERLTQPIHSNSEAEHRVIIRALLAVTKDYRSGNDDPGVSPEVSKFVADQIVRHAKIPLREFDFQNAQLCGAWWKNVNAAGTDFWRANLSSVGMRGANLQCCQLVEARLDKSVLVGANLTGARLDRASLCGTNLRSTLIEGAVFDGAIYDDATLLPEGFDPVLHGLRRASKPDVAA